MAAPPLRLILGRAGSGKTRTCLQAYARDPAGTRIVLPTTQAVEMALSSLRRMGVEPTETEITDWAGFLSHCLNETDQAREPLDLNRRVALCARLCERLLTEDAFFGSVGQMPGFHLRLVQRFEEWSLAGLTPDGLERAAQLLTGDEQLKQDYDLQEPTLQGEWTRKIGELVRLWSAYREQLSHLRRTDPADRCWLAIEAIRKGRKPPFRTCYFDGFWTLSEAGFALIEALLNRGVRVCLTLLYDPERPTLFASTALLKERLGERFATETVVLPPPKRFEQESLALLEAALFHDRVGEGESGGMGEWGNEHATASVHDSPPHHPITSPQASSLSPSPTLPLSHSPIHIFDTPSLLSEVETVARHILLLNHQGMPFEEIAFLLRNPEHYAHYLQVLFERYDIPLHWTIQEPLLHNPLIGTVAEWLQWLIGDWDLGVLFDWLRNPYVPFPKAQWGRLRRMAFRARIRDASAFALWLEKIAGEGFEAEANYLQELLEARTQLQGLATLRQVEGKELLACFHEWLRTLILQDSVLFLCTRRDQLALQQALEVAQAQSEFFSAGSTLEWVHAVLRFWREAFYSYPVGERGVRVLPIEEADYGQPRVAFVMGLIEGSFPRHHVEDAFLREVERRALTATVRQYAAAFPELAHPESFYLPLRHELLEAERLRFYRAVTAPREQLYLSYPSAGQDSEELPSFYLNDVQDAVGTERIQFKMYRLSEVAPRPEEALTSHDQLLIWAKNGGRGEWGNRGMGENPLAPSFFFSPTPPFSHSSTLNHPEVRAWAAKLDRALSVTELESLARCAFQHLARYRLQIPAPGRGLQNSRIGSLLHAALQATFARKRSEGVPEDPQAMANTLIQHLDRLIEEQTPELASWQLLVLREYCAHLLNGFAHREARYRQQFGVQPLYFEWAFGEQAEADEGEGLSRPRDPDSRRAPLSIRIPGEGAVNVCGVVDRIDVDPQAGVAMLVDYKLDSVVTKSQMEKLESFQMPLYARAVQETLGVQQVVLAYDSLAGERRYRILPPQLATRFNKADWEGSARDIYDLFPPVKWGDLQRKVEGQIIALVQLLKDAEVAPHPGDHCQHCAFGDFCRVAQR